MLPSREGSCAGRAGLGRAGPCPAGRSPAGLRSEARHHPTDGGATPPGGGGAGGHILGDCGAGCPVCVLRGLPWASPAMGLLGFGVTPRPFAGEGGLGGMCADADTRLGRPREINAQRK